jgi:1,4-alpha-glucan branching enzyme
MANDPVHRAYHHGEKTFSLVYQWSENYVLPISHDEVVHGKGSLLRKMPGDRWKQLANLRAYLRFMWAHPGKQLLFMGAEMGQESEWAEARELDWWLLDHPEHLGVQKLVVDLNGLYRGTPALHARDHDPEGFQWIDGGDAARNLLSFIRRAPGSGDVVCVSNFAAIPHHGVRLGLPSVGTWEEVLNTDAESYTGSGVGNLGSVDAVAGDWSGQPAYADITVPPLATVWFRRREG